MHACTLLISSTLLVRQTSIFLSACRMSASTFTQNWRAKSQTKLLAAPQAQPKPAREHQREIQSRKVSLNDPIDNRKDHHTRGQDEPKNHTDYTQPIGPRDKPENILQNPGDQRDQHTHRPQRIFERIHRAINLRPHPTKVLMQPFRTLR